MWDLSKIIIQFSKVHVKIEDSSENNMPVKPVDSAIMIPVKPNNVADFESNLSNWSLSSE